MFKFLFFQCMYCMYLYVFVCIICKNTFCKLKIHADTSVGICMYMHVFVCSVCICMYLIHKYIIVYSYTFKYIIDCIWMYWYVYECINVKNTWWIHKYLDIHDRLYSNVLVCISMYCMYMLVHGCTALGKQKGMYWYVLYVSCVFACIWIYVSIWMYLYVLLV